MTQEFPDDLDILAGTCVQQNYGRNVIDSSLYKKRAIDDMRFPIYY